MQKRRIGLADRLRSLLAKGHFSVFLGAGASACAGYPLMDDLTKAILHDLPPSRFPLVHQVWDSVKNDGHANIETVMGRLHQFLAVCRSNPDVMSLDLNEVQACVSEIENSVVSPFLETKDIEVHKRLLQIICQLNITEHPTIATSNYDMLIERACEAAGVWCLDGFVGVNERKWRGESLPLQLGTVEGRKFHHCRKAIRLLKLHGSVSWVTDGEEIVAHVDGPVLKKAKKRRMIFPTPRKVSETFDEPYSSLQRQFITALERPNALLVTLGFSYRDAHLVEPIKQFVTRQDHTVVALVRKPEGILNELLTEPNVICVAESGAWLDGRGTEPVGGIWQLPEFVEFLEGL
jgi:hypothetical protein